MSESDSVSVKALGKREQIKQRLRQWMDEQGLTAGDRLLSQTQFAEIFDTTEVTMHRVLTELADEGLVYRVKGRGTFVNAQPAAVDNGAICLVLPGHNLDKPQVNPGAWSVVQSLIRSFVQCTIEGQPFSVHGVSPSDDLHAAAQAVEQSSAVFFHFTQSPRALIDLLIERGRVPVVCLGRPHPDLPCLTIDHDRFTGVKLSAEYLLNCGYRRIAVVASRAIHGQITTAGYALALEDAGVGYDETLVARFLSGEQYEASLKTAVGEMLDRGCDAILTDTDIVGLTIYRELRSRHIKVPDDVGLMGYDGLDWAMYHPPYLTTLEVPWTRLISQAMDRIGQQIGRKSPHEHVEMVGEVVAGKTTAEWGCRT